MFISGDIFFKVELSFNEWLLQLMKLEKLMLCTEETDSSNQWEPTECWSDQGSTVQHL